MRKIIPSPTAFASFTGLVEYVGNNDADLSRNLAENVDLPAIFRTLDQGVGSGADTDERQWRYCDLLRTYGDY